MCYSDRTCDMGYDSCYSIFSSLGWLLLPRNISSFELSLSVPTKLIRCQPYGTIYKMKKVAQLFIFKNPSMLFGRLNKKNRAKSKKIVITLWFANRNQNLSYMVQLFIVLLKISKAMLLLTSGDQKELSRVRVSSIKDSILHIHLRKF